MDIMLGIKEFSNSFGKNAFHKNMKILTIFMGVKATNNKTINYTQMEDYIAQWTYYGLLQRSGAFT
ncbi:hypothetical protein T12_15640 [Trichinella patagoniensis]|uniref:Uncharacterized protein n=1 Tax=Trichinella patagoniensis TaxID=990121 RepID=A0A0V0ZRF6_9BILA|nr:hypothetical protein T12_15640 [Trichinella patagoniensis]